MKELVIMGDPGSIYNALNEILKYNPQMKIIAKCCGNYFAQQAGKVHQLGQPANGTVPVNVLYITYEGFPLKDKNGNEIK